VIHVLDWKTGREREVDHTQVGVYVLYARQKWGAVPRAVTGELVYLAGGGERVSVAVGDEELESCRGAMRSSIAAMRQRLADPARNVARLEQFPQVAAADRCARCAFRRPCGRL
jgi:hypothetical protein